MPCLPAQDVLMAFRGVPNSVIRVRQNGNWSVVADLSAFQMSHPVVHPEPDDFEPDGTWYSMVRVDDDLYAVEPNHGELDKINPRGGKVRRVIDIFEQARDISFRRLLLIIKAISTWGI